MKRAHEHADSWLLHFRATFGGAALLRGNSRAAFNRCTFLNNNATQHGAALALLYDSNSRPAFALLSGSSADTSKNFNTLGMPALISIPDLPMKVWADTPSGVLVYTVGGGISEPLPLSSIPEAYGFLAQDRVSFISIAQVCGIGSLGWCWAMVLSTCENIN
jgi:hypothetical protein